jgi:two-component system, chemotaxis family, chemotaxis protein CheY
MNGGHFLTVEDEPDAQEVVATLFRRANITCDTASTGEDALTLLGENAYTGVIIDLALPGMDGLKLLETIRATPEIASLPCMAITAYHTSVVRQQAMQSGFDAYFPKPLDPKEFVPAVLKVISGNRG